MLLATYNGGRYIKEFLDSLAGQAHVAINLFISDDGSSDNTVAIAEAYKDTFKSMLMLDGPRKGACANFISLLPHSKAEFMAFADQDDVWNSDHLIKSIDRIRDSGNRPALTYSAVEKFFESGAEPDISPRHSKIPNFERMYVECFARGCTMVMNRAAVDLLTSTKIENAIMHDWWTLLAIRSCGKVIYEEKPEIRYRVHNTNTSGPGVRSWKLTLEKIRKREWVQYTQILGFYENFKSKMDDDASSRIQRFIDSLQGPWYKRFFYLLLSRTRYRSTLYDEVRTRIGFLFFTVLFRVNRDSKRS